MLYHKTSCNIPCKRERLFLCVKLVRQLLQNLITFENMVGMGEGVEHWMSDQEKKLCFISSFKTLCTEIYFGSERQKKKDGAHFFSFTQTQTVIISDSQQLARTELKYPKKQGLCSTLFLLLESLIYPFFKY